MITEKAKLKLLDRSTQDLLEIRTLIDNELNIREDNQINIIEFDTLYDKSMKIYHYNKTTNMVSS